MKTIEKIRNLKRLTASACVALVLSAGSYAQPSPENDINAELNSLSRLEKRMQLTEQAIRFIAPEVQEEIYAESTGEIGQALDNLEMLAGVTEESLQYNSPALGHENGDSEMNECDKKNTSTEKPVFLVENSQQRNDIMLMNCKNNPDIIQVGYYQHVKVTIWSRLRKIITARPAARRNSGSRIITTTYIVNADCSGQLL